MTSSWVGRWVAGLGRALLPHLRLPGPKADPRGTSFQGHSQGTGARGEGRALEPPGTRVQIPTLLEATAGVGRAQSCHPIPTSKMGRVLPKQSCGG